MGTFLICPGERPGVGFLAEHVPLVLLPVLGHDLLHYWLETLVENGSREISVLVTDRPDMVASALGNGSRWGVRIEVQRELQELTVRELATRIPRDSTGETHEESARIVLLDQLPGLAEYPLFRSYQDWFAAVIAWLLHAGWRNALGIKEILPQVWCGRRTRIAPNVVLRGPCWIGDHVQIAKDAIIGPNAVLEDRVIVDTASEIKASLIGPETFVGALTKVEGSIAWGNTLIDWRTGSCTQVPDPFLLCALGKPASENRLGTFAWFSNRWLSTGLWPWGVLHRLAARFRK